MSILYHSILTVAIGVCGFAVGVSTGIFLHRQRLRRSPSTNVGVEPVVSSAWRDISTWITRVENSHSNPGVRGPYGYIGYIGQKKVEVRMYEPNRVYVFWSYTLWVDGSLYENILYSPEKRLRSAIDTLTYNWV